MPNAIETPERPLVTFALLAYNQEKYIREAVKGAFAQKYEPLEIILSDDCSTDRTYQIMQEMATAYDGPHRLKLERNHQNLGKSNFGLRVWKLLNRASGDLIVIAAGDDISYKDRSSRLCEIWTSLQQPKCCIHSLARPIDELGNSTGNPVGCNRIQDISLKRFIKTDGRGLLGATNAISASLLKSFDRPPDPILFEDGIFAFRARLCDGIFFVPEILVDYRRHGDNMTNSTYLKKNSKLKQYSHALETQQIGYLYDYINTQKNIDPKIIKYISKRLNQIKKINWIHNRNPLKRLIAALRLYQHINPFLLRIKISLNIAIKSPINKKG